MVAIGDVMAPHKRKRHIVRYSNAGPGFYWKPGGGHVHNLETKEVYFAGAMLVIDKCLGPNCEYEAGRDLISATNQRS